MVHDDIGVLPPGHHSLVHGGDAMPGGLLALSVCGGVRVPPAEGRSVYFGRNFEEVHVGIGVDDRRVSRRQGVLTCRDGSWWVANTGNRPIRLPGSRWLRRGGAAVPLAAGYTPLFVPGAGARDHLLELYVAGPAVAAATVSTWRLSPDERLATVVLGRLYLLHEAEPRPLPWRQAAAELAELEPGRWPGGRLERLVADLRARHGVAGPIDALLRELVRTATLVPPDLALLDRPGCGGGP